MSQLYEPAAGNQAKSRGEPTLVWEGEVVAVNANGTVDVRSRLTRAGKIHVPVLGIYTPTIGDRVLMSNLNGDAQTPVCLGPLTRIGATPMDGAGPMADRPNAVDVPDYFTYYATDDWGGSEYRKIGGSWVLTASKNQIAQHPSAAASITFSDLDGGADEFYRLEYFLAVSAAGPLMMRVNGISTASYYDYLHEGYSSTYGSQNEGGNAWRINDSSGGGGGSLFTGQVLLQAKPAGGGTYPLSMAAVGGYYDTLAYNAHGIAAINQNVSSIAVFSGTGATLSGLITVKRLLTP